MSLYLYLSKDEDLDEKYILFQRKILFQNNYELKNKIVKSSRHSKHQAPIAAKICKTGNMYRYVIEKFFYLEIDKLINNGWKDELFVTIF